MVVLLYVLCHSLGFFEPILLALDGLIGFVDSRLIILFWHPLSDFDRGDPFGRLLTYAIVIMFPAILLTVLLVALASIGPLLHRRADRNDSTVSPEIQGLGSRLQGKSDG